MHKMGVDYHGCEAPIMEFSLHPSLRWCFTTKNWRTIIICIFVKTWGWVFSN